VSDFFSQIAAVMGCHDCLDIGRQAAADGF
jgi:hypothetical protein